MVSLGLKISDYHATSENHNNSETCENSHGSSVKVASPNDCKNNKALMTRQTGDAKRFNKPD